MAKIFSKESDNIQKTHSEMKILQRPTVSDLH